MARVKSIGVFSVMKMFAVMYGILGLIFGAIFSLIAMLGAAGSQDLGPFGALLGVGSIVIFPIVYSCVGALGGAVGALIYNVCASFAGGVEVELS